MVGLGALLAAEVAAVGLLHRLGTLPWLRVGWEDLGAWLAAVPPEDALVATLRVVALVGAYWLVVTTAGYALARVSRLPAAVRSVQWATLPVVRRIADRAVAVALAGTTVAVSSPGLAAAVVPPPAVRAPAELPGTPADLPAEPPTAPGSPGPPAPPPGTPGAPASSPARPSTDAGEASITADPATAHVVAAGENLWVITEAALGGAATDAQVAAHWRAVVDANRARLRSGDPDLIYPGEQVVLPPPEHPTSR